MAAIPWQQQVARWTNGSEVGRIIACLDRELQSTIRRYASFQETPSLHAKGSLGYLNSMYFSILYKMHMCRKQILRGFSVFSRPIFLICVCVGNVKRFVWFVGLVVWLAAAKSWFGSCMCWSPGGGLLVRWACIQWNLQVCLFFFVQHWFLMLHVESDGQIVECVLCLFFVCSLF